MVLKSKRNKQFAVRHSKNIKSSNCNLRKIHKQFGQHNTGEQHTGRQRSDSAEPYTIGFPKSNFRAFHINHCIKLKSFSVQQFFKNAAEVWASSPHLRSKFNFASLVFLLQLHFLKLTNLQLDCFMKQVANSDKATGQLQHAGRQRSVSLRAIFALFHVKHCS